MGGVGLSAPKFKGILVQVTSCQEREGRVGRKIPFWESWKENSLPILWLMCSSSSSSSRFLGQPQVRAAHPKARAHLWPGVPASCRALGEWHTCERGKHTNQTPLQWKNSARERPGTSGATTPSTAIKPTFSCVRKGSIQHLIKALS